MRSFLIICFLLISVQANADWYIMTKDSRVIARTMYLPDINDLNSRGEFAIESNEDFMIGDVDYRNNKLVKHVKTAEEVQKEKELKDKKEKEEQVKQETIKKLKALGLTEEEILSIFYHH